MALYFTFHGPNRADEASGNAIDTIEAQRGARVDVASGAASSAVGKEGLYRIGVDAESYVKIATDATNGTDGEYWPAGHVEVRILKDNEKIGVTSK